jgi:hypothetical protein
MSVAILYIALTVFGALAIGAICFSICMCLWTDLVIRNIKR